MNQDLIAQRCEDMEEEELVRAVTVERGERIDRKSRCVERHDEEA